jgi:hypothetical protein
MVRVSVRCVAQLSRDQRAARDGGGLSAAPVIAASDEELMDKMDAGNLIDRTDL